MLKILALSFLLISSSNSAFANQVETCEAKDLFSKVVKLVEGNYPGTPAMGRAIKSSIRMTLPLPEAVIRENGGAPIVAVFNFQYIGSDGQPGAMAEAAMQINLDYKSCLVSYSQDGNLMKFWSL